MRPAKSERTEPENRDPFGATLLAAELSDDTPEIDLHGENADVALQLLESFLHHELMAGNESIRIIHGKGTQTLQKKIFIWLEKQKQLGLIAAYRGATVATGQQNAVTYAALHRLK